MKLTTLFTALTIATCVSAQTRDPAEPILPTIITIKPTLITRSLTLIITPTPATSIIITKPCGLCPISTTKTITPIFKRPPICPEYLCFPCNDLSLEKRGEEVEKRQLPTSTVLASCCCGTLPPTTTTVTKHPCPNPCACTITTTIVAPSCVRPTIY
ncbi:hypothetical protein TWF481_003076 [Arthrobotrys musiformis]|uniref:Uncharacterized protein n=1 Tax=Arthrobotrys musiformis TaxID=47236 RepID=A0AAV9VRC8_9PEZI